MDFRASKKLCNLLSEEVIQDHVNALELTNPDLQLMLFRHPRKKEEIVTAILTVNDDTGITITLLDELPQHIQKQLMYDFGGQIMNNDFEVTVNFFS